MHYFVNKLEKILVILDIYTKGYILRLWNIIRFLIKVPLKVTQVKNLGLAGYEKKVVGPK